MARVELNVQAPNFTLNDFNGRSVSLSDYINKKMSWLFSIADFFDPSAARTWRSCARIMRNWGQIFFLDNCKRRTTQTSTSPSFPASI